jgi:phosphomannomutase
MALKFGTSGVRGLVTEMTDRECYLYTKVFARYLKSKTPVTRVALAGDFRSSTPRIMRAVAFALREEGMHVDDCGLIPTPAVINYGIRNDEASIMVTGSHIPDDRNGIKFNMPWGEVLKDDEKEISGRYESLASAGREEPSPFGLDGYFKSGAAGDEAGAAGGDGAPESTGTAHAAETAGADTTEESIHAAARDAYIERYTKFFPPDCLKSLKIVFYQHSTVSREILPHVLETLGAEVVRVGFSKSFIALDTEAVEDPERLRAWVAEFGANALVSADGDGDRPLVVDETGEIIRGDVLGILVADFLGADSVSTPVSCNTAVEKCGRFASVSRTRIGSPYVIASMNEARGGGMKTIVGYEANGGFLTASEITDPSTGAALAALPTRDAALPIICILLASLRKKLTLSALVAELPPRFTMSGLLRGFPREQGKELVETFHARGEAYANELFSSAFGSVASIDFTDGARMTFASGDIVHLRPSGNAPEFRCYTEADSEQRADDNNKTALELVEKLKASMTPGDQ